MRESLLLHSTNIVVYPNILLFMGLHYFISFAVFVVQFSRCVLNGCLLCYRRLVGTSGFEPPTSRLSGVRSNQLSYKPILKSYDSSGDEEIRTLDPLLARQVLSQLSYIPIIWRPPALPHRLQCSTIGRLGLNRRVRDGNGCFP